MAKLLTTLIFTFSLSLSVISSADENNVKTFDNYEVHYSVFNSSFLTPDVAKAYNIVRSKSSALMNISILQKQPDGSRKPVKATVSGSQYDLIRHLPLSFIEVEEQDARYYLSSFEITHKTTIYFTVLIQVESDQEPYKLQFNKLLYKDE